MIITTIRAAKNYDVLIGEDILRTLPDELLKRNLIHEKKQTKISVITDDNIAPLYLRSLEKILKRKNIDPFYIVIPHGEDSKSPRVYFEILELLSLFQFSKSDLIFALGGGVVGDLAGFCASTYLRGIPFVQLPTTLLAAVDSSIGGKTAVNLPCAKNLVGTFYQPALVLCDLTTLKTLPKNILACGYAEVVKYAMLYGKELSKEVLQLDPNAPPPETLVAKCIDIKRNFIEQDEHDQASRQLLNFGHTIAHSIETLSEYKIPHGEAVAAGMAIMTRSALKQGKCPKACLKTLLSMLERFDLAYTTPYSASQLAQAAGSDKKRWGNAVNLVIPKDLGHCVIERTDLSALTDIIAAGL